MEQARQLCLPKGGVCLMMVSICETCFMLTFTTLGTFVAAFIKSSDAKCVLLSTKSSDGPISSTSTRGVRLPDFFNNTLK